MLEYTVTNKRYTVAARDLDLILERGLSDVVCETDADEGEEMVHTLSAGDIVKVAAGKVEDIFSIDSDGEKIEFIFLICGRKIRQGQLEPELITSVQDEANYLTSHVDSIAPVPVNRATLCVLLVISKNMAKEKSLVETLNEKAGKKIAFQGIDDEIEEAEVIPTGIMPLDFALGCGGIPRGKITDIYGLPSVGKSSVCFTLMAQAQKQGLTVAIIDAEYSYHPEYVRSFGVDTEKLLIVQPDCLEEAAEAIEALVRAKTGLIIVDSISSLIPQALAEADHGKAPMAMQARGIKDMLLKILAPVAKNQTALVCINQMRVNIMAMHPGDKWSVTGGWALKFYSTIRIEVKKLKALMKKDEQIGYIAGFKVTKNKLGRAGLTCEVPFIFGTGFQADGDLIQMGVDRGLITQEGAYYVIDGTKYHGKEKAVAALDNDPSVKAKIIAALFPPQSPQPQPQE